MQQGQKQGSMPEIISPFANMRVSKRSLFRYLGSLGLLAVILIFCAVLTMLSPVFFTATNWVNLLLQSTILAVLAMGLTFVMMTGGIDLSVGAVLAVSSMIGLDLIVDHQAPVLVGVAASLLIGILFGLVNGIMVTRVGIPPLIVTLATMGVARGIVLIYSDGAKVTKIPDSIIYWANGEIEGIPVLLLIVGLLAMIAHILLSHTIYGRSLRASGGNELAARLAGVRTKGVITGAYVLSGATASIAGLLLAARLESAGPNAGLGMEQTVIAAVVIGGTSLFGGQGHIVGTLLGVLLISLVSNAVNLLNVPPAWDQVVKGLVILIAALLDVYRRKYSQDGYSK
ncbi:ABC transporter permease [Paenibacillus validus]|uniref:ABC transporter permease n=1 Tax=Paenibacillus validus TaxID=44253 RepID=UPI000FD7A451|nr:ABC transporter permease [Paenibacillus validus]MED4600422.1 ABC transporter permease [Paenibacillus validus]MED4607859.1 ABC transporter permease [Paenibacillus validus]